MNDEILEECIDETDCDNNEFCDNGHCLGTNYIRKYAIEKINDVVNYSKYDRLRLIYFIIQKKDIQLPLT